MTLSLKVLVREPLAPKAEIELTVVFLKQDSQTYEVIARPSTTNAQPMNLGVIRINDQPADLFGYVRRLYLASAGESLYQVNTVQEALDWLWVHHCRVVRGQASAKPKSAA